MNKKHNSGLRGRRVEVIDGQFEKSLRKFRKKVENSGVLKDLQDKEFYTPPSARRVRREAQAKKRWQKYLKSQNLPGKTY